MSTFDSRKCCMGYDVMSFESLTQTQFCLENNRVRKWYFLGMLSVGFWLESDEICKTNHHTLAGSLRRCLNTRPNGLMFKQFPRDWANVNA